MHPTIPKGLSLDLGFQFFEYLGLGNWHVFFSLATFFFLNQNRYANIIYDKII